MQPEAVRFDRRALIGAGVAAALTGPGAAEAARMEAIRFLAVEKTAKGGRLGVCAFDTGSGRRLDYRASERFPMCSTFKWLAAAAVLARVDHGTERLDRRIAYGRADLLSVVSPTTKAHVAEGGLPLEVLCRAAVTESDNTAANLILKDSLGGPAGLTRWLRSAGDSVTRLDHHEPELNNPPPGDPHDTTTPAAMVGNLQRFLLSGAVLSPASRARLTGWLVANTTGATRLRAGLPAGWRVGDKTGSWGGVSANDLAIAWPPGRPPLLIAAYCTGGKLADAARNETLAEAARVAVSALGLS